MKIFILSVIKIWHILKLKMTKIEVNDCVYNIHPVYDLYGADSNGNITHIIKKIPNKGNKKPNGYMLESMDKMV